MMLVVTTSLDSPKLSPEAFARTPRLLYRHGTRYGRLEEQPDPDKRIHGLIVVNEPDIWIINLMGSTGQHVVDPGPSIEFHVPILSGAGNVHWTGFEFGSEVAYMKAVGAVPSQLADGGSLYSHSFEGLEV